MRPKPSSHTNAYLLFFRPQHALVFFCNWSQAFVHELLQTLSTVGFSRVDVALRIRGDAVHGVELTGLPPAVAKTRQRLKCVAQQNVNLFVSPVRQIDVLLSWVLRKSDVPNRPIA